MKPFKAALDALRIGLPDEARAYVRRI